MSRRRRPASDGWLGHALHSEHHHPFGSEPLRIAAYERLEFHARGDGSGAVCDREICRFRHFSGHSPGFLTTIPHPLRPIGVCPNLPIRVFLPSQGSASGDRLHWKPPVGDRSRVRLVPPSPGSSAPTSLPARRGADSTQPTSGSEARAHRPRKNLRRIIMPKGDAAGRTSAANLGPRRSGDSLTYAPRGERLPPISALVGQAIRSRACRGANVCRQSRPSSQAIRSRTCRGANVCRQSRPSSLRRFAHVRAERDASPGILSLARRDQDSR